MNSRSIAVYGERAPALDQRTVGIVRGQSSKVEKALDAMGHAQSKAEAAQRNAAAIMRQRVSGPERELRRAQEQYEQAIREAQQDPAYRAARHASRAADIQAQHSMLKVQKSLNDVQAALNNASDHVDDDQYYSAMTQMRAGVERTVFDRIVASAQQDPQLKD